MKQYPVLVTCLVAAVSAMYSPDDDVIDLNPSNFNQLVMNGNELWIVEFYAPWCGHCQSLAPEYKKAATALKGIVKVGAVDMDQHQSLGQPYDVRGFPTLKVFGGNKNSPTDYNGQRTAQGIVDTAMAQVRTLASDRLAGRSKTSSGGSGGGSRGGSSGGSGRGNSGGDAKDVIELTDSNFNDLVVNSEDMWLVEFFAPWCGHCKSLAPHWQQAASDLKGKVKLGALDATVHQGTAQRYGVQGYPTIKMFPAGKKDEAVNFDGGRTAADIVAWALDRFSENIPAPEVAQLTAQSHLNMACEEHQLCIVAILPHILDCQAECRNGYISIMQALADKYKKRNWGWVWAEAGAQMNVEEAFGIGGFGYPAMAALNSRKMKFALMRGSFGETGINEFLRELAVGRGNTAPLKNAALPTVENTDSWDGKDGVLPVEEDIDLSDVELDDLDMDKKDEL